MAAKRSTSATAPPLREDGDSLFESLIGMAVDGIMMIDERGIVRVYNRACETLFGYEAAEVIGRNVKMLMPEPYRGEHDAYLDHYVKTSEKHIIGIGREVSGRRKDGSAFPLRLAVGEGVVRGDRIFLGIITDISAGREQDRKIQELQAEMLHVSRLTDMGQVAAGLAHELNQPLTAILNYSNASIEIAEEKGDAELVSIFGKVAEQAARAGNIIRRLRGFLEKRGPNMVPEDLARVVDEAIRLGQVNAAERGVKLRVILAPDLPPVRIDRVQIQQVLINLVKNAIEAMEGASRRELTMTISQTAPEKVQVAVADTGPGIANDLADKLFQPFVTTKANGMGMGLSICRGIVEAHGGRLWIEDNPGGGALFRFTVGVAQEAEDGG
ncbi:MAG TPA: ATP-binding protein [Rhizomicrobium sp.]|nr:ATP-binding protein [Rhizomicrobium sp.]